MSKLLTCLGRNQKSPICFNLLELNAILYSRDSVSWLPGEPDKGGGFWVLVPVDPTDPEHQLGL